MIYHAIYVPPGQAPFPREIVHVPEITRYVQGWGRPGDSGIIAIFDEKPVGAAWVRVWAGQDHGYGYVAEDIPELSVALLPEFRGKGYGKSMISLLMDAVKDYVRGISLSVSVDNPAVRLYEELGFEIISRDSETLTMLKNL